MESDEIPIVLSFTSNVRALIDENSIDIVASLRDQKLDVRRSNFQIEPSDEKHGLKSPELIILASAAAAPLVSAAIARVIDAINRGRKTVVATSETDVKLAKSIASEHSFKVGLLGLSVSMEDRFER